MKIINKSLFSFLSKNNKKNIPYGKHQITNDDIREVVKILKSDFLTQGPILEKFESEISKFIGCKFSIAVNSGTSALHIACKALDLCQKDILWTSPITFVASANCAKYCGAEVDFVDIDLETGLICPKKLKEKLVLANELGKLPKILIPVHLSGSSCDMKALYKLSEEYGFKIIEDASHALGGSYFNELIGKCTYSHMTVFSFHPVKMITTGEGGMVTTNDYEIATKLKQLRTHGIVKDPNSFFNKSPAPWFYEQQILGFNYRMTDFQAALGISQLKRLPIIVNKRRAILNRYKSELKDEPIIFLKEKNGVKSSVHLVIIRLKNASSIKHRKLFQALRNEEIGVQLHYIPVHLQPYYKQQGFSEGQFPNSEKYSQSAMSLPVYPELSEKNFQRVIKTLKNLLKKLKIK